MTPWRRRKNAQAFGHVDLGGGVGPILRVGITPSPNPYHKERRRERVQQIGMPLFFPDGPKRHLGSPHYWTPSSPKGSPTLQRSLGAGYCGGIVELRGLLPASFWSLREEGGVGVALPQPKGGDFTPRVPIWRQKRNKNSQVIILNEWFLCPRGFNYFEKNYIYPLGRVTDRSAKRGCGLLQWGDRRAAWPLPLDRGEATAGIMKGKGSEPSLVVRLEKYYMFQCYLKKKTKERFWVPNSEKK